MAGSLASINVRFSADLKGFTSQMQNATKEIGQVGKKMQDVGKTMSLAVTAPIALLGAKSLQVFDTQAKAIAAVEAGLKSTGNQVGYTSDKLQKMASDLQNVSLFGDEEILQGVTAQLLTFTNIAGEQFAKTQQAALDLATRLDGDLKSASIQLGKALNDPIANLSALSRSGIQFSEDQKKVINALQKSGKLAEAQNIILAELEKQYGGSAAAAAKAGTGGIKQLSNSFGDLLETFGAIISDGIQPLVSYLKSLVESLNSLSPETKKVIVVIAGLAAAIGPLLLVVGTMLTLVPTVVAGFIAIKGAFIALTATMATNPFGLALIAASALVVALAVFKAKTDEVNKSYIQLTNQVGLLNKVQAEASVGVNKFKSSIDPLIGILKNQNTTLGVRKKAYEELIKIAPEFIGTVDAEFRATEKLSLAYNKLLVGIQNKLKAQAKESVIKKYYEEEAKAVDTVFQAQLKYNNLLQKYQSLSDYAKQYTVEAKALYDDLIASSAALTIAKKNEQTATKNLTEVERFRTSELQKLLNEQSKYAKGSKEYIDIQTQIDLLLNAGITTVNGLSKSYEGLAKSKEKVFAAGTIAFYENEISKLKEIQNQATLTSREYLLLGQQIDGFQSKIDAISTSLEPVKVTMDNEQFKTATLENSKYFTEQVDRIKEQGQRFLEDRDAENAALLENANQTKEAYGIIGQSFIDVFSSFSQGFVDSLGIANEGMKAFVSSLIGTITKLISMALSASLANSIQGASQSAVATGPGAVFAQPAFIATAIGGIIAAFASIPKFETGGIVGGSSYSGDKILARLNSGELVLNQKQQSGLFGMLNEGGSNVNIGLDGSFKLSGSDLELVINRAINRNSRKR
jgi:hypothetical protein